MVGGDLLVCRVVLPLFGGLTVTLVQFGCFLLDRFGRQSSLAFFTVLAFFSPVVPSPPPPVFGCGFFETGHEQFPAPCLGS